MGAAPTGNHDQLTPGPSKKPKAVKIVGNVHNENSAYLEHYLFGFLPPLVLADRNREDSDSDDPQNSAVESDTGLYDGTFPSSVPI